MPDYSQGKQYILREYNANGAIFYNGSTTQKLSSRKNGHKTCAKNDKKKNYPVYKHINEVLNGEFIIELYENCPCKDKDELLKREGEITRMLLGQGVDLKNFQTAGEMARFKTKPKYDSNYYQNNKQKILANLQTKITCECGSVVSKMHHARHERSIKHQKFLGVSNPKVIQLESEKKREENVTCECGFIVVKRHLKIHQATKKHKNQLENPVELIVCECGEQVTKQCLTRHKRTELHKSKLQTKTE